MSALREDLLRELEVTMVPGTSEVKSLIKAVHATIMWTTIDTTNVIRLVADTT